MSNLPSPEMLSRDVRFVALDVETANADAASICQIGIALVDASGAMETHSFFIDPRDPFAPFNTRLHGISAATVALIEATDPAVADILRAEADRQSSTLELIASENHVTSPVMHAAGTWMTNKYAEGYPGKRCTAVVNTWTSWKNWPSSVPKKYLARNM